MQRYRIFGLEVASDLPLEMVSAGDETLPAQVSVTLMPAFDGNMSGAGEVYRIRDTVVMTVAGVARYHIADGAHISIEPVPEARPSDIELFLTGSAFGLMLQQRGLVVLHANALSDGARALCVLGPSGAGKSTLAARLCTKGFPLLSDDLSAVESTSSLPPRVLPGIPRFRLWGDAATALGIDHSSLRRVRGSADKYVLAADHVAAAPVPLSALYVLEQAVDANPSRFEALRGAEAVAALMANSYRGQYLRHTGASEAHFAHCVALARGVPIIRWWRKWGRADEESGVASLIEHFRSISF